MNVQIEPAVISGERVSLVTNMFIVFSVGTATVKGLDTDYAKLISSDRSF